MRVSRHRRRKGLSQKDFAAALKWPNGKSLSQGFINDIESGRRKPPKDLIVSQMAVLLDCGEDELRISAGRVPSSFLMKGHREGDEIPVLAMLKPIQDVIHKPWQGKEHFEIAMKALGQTAEALDRNLETNAKEQHLNEIASSENREISSMFHMAAERQIEEIRKICTHFEDMHRKQRAYLERLSEVNQETNAALREAQRGIEMVRSELLNFTLQARSISEKVRMFVWTRDEGRCVKCGVNENLEYDHIIPISKGGSHTERNLQLLCAQCNREKRDSV
jgi:transcriptional regulator with XRE-family HTH domain